MEHNMHPNVPTHWSYTTAPVPSTLQNHWISPPQNHVLKRAISESDCEELYSEESSKEQISPSEPGSCQLMSRKKRRGVIEKKRRDRINSSLSELKRLVPSAYEKQGSAKLEKAEILQLTVEHLKNMHSKGMDSLNYDPQRFAMDYHIIGFRECAAEVARYLVTIEGMDIQDPLRLRLMSHLQYFVQQRELSAKSCSNSTNWAGSGSGSGYQPNCAVSPYQSYHTASSAHSSVTSSYVSNLPLPIHPYPALSSSPGTSNMHQQQPILHVRSNSASNEAIPILNNAVSQQTQHPQRHHQTVTAHEQLTPTSHDNLHQSSQQYNQEHQHQEHHNATYIELTNAQGHRNTTPSDSGGELNFAGTSQYPGSAPHDYNPNATAINFVSANGSKPYRPWGAEMAY